MHSFQHAGVCSLVKGLLSCTCILKKTGWSINGPLLAYRATVRETFGNFNFGTNNYAYTCELYASSQHASKAVLLL